MKINNIEIYWTYNKGKSVVAERFIGTLKDKIFKHMTAISKNVCFDVSDDIVNKFQKIISEGRKPNKYGLIKVVNFRISFLKDFWK